MLESILELIRGRRVVPAAPPSFTPKLPAVDASDYEEPDDLEPDLESVAGIGCIITYEDTKGAVSIRRVTCRKLSNKGAVLYLQAFCHERTAMRTFRVDRIDEIACGVTGEVFPSADAFFERYEVSRTGGAAVGFGLSVKLATDLRAGLNVLAFLAKADGRLCPDEAEAVEGFCRSFAMRYAGDEFDFEGAGRYACELAPDAETFYTSLHRLKREGAPEGLPQLTKRWAGQVIDADGEHHTKEFYFGQKVQEYLAV